MTNIRILLTALATGVVLVAVATVAFASPSGLRGGPPPQTIELFVAAGDPVHVDELEPGLGAGDWLLFRDPVLDIHGLPAGTAITRVQVVAPVGDGDLAFILDCTIDLDGGRLVFGGADQLSNLGASTTYAVVGGTGDRSGARGQVTGTPDRVGDTPGTRLTFELRTP